MDALGGEGAAARTALSTAARAAFRQHFSERGMRVAVQPGSAGTRPNACRRVGRRSPDPSISRSSRGLLGSILRLMPPFQGGEKTISRSARRMRRGRLALGVVACALTLAGGAAHVGLDAAPAVAAGVGDCAPAADWPANDAAKASRVVELVNEHRTSLGLGRLAVTGTLQASAVWKSRHMARYVYMAHEDPAPPVARGVGDRLAACGYAVTTGWWGENVAFGFQTPEAVMAAWLNSSGHRANIENRLFTFIGVGAARAANGAVYWTQNFGTQGDPAPPAPPRRLLRRRRLRPLPRSRRPRRQFRLLRRRTPRNLQPRRPLRPVIPRAWPSRQACGSSSEGEPGPGA